MARIRRLATRLALLALLVAAFAFGATTGRAQAPVVVTVNSVADPIDGAGACPSDSTCTLRKAILFANAESSSAPVIITFSPTVFPKAAPATIVLSTPLPPLTRANVAVDAVAAGVTLQGSALPLTQPFDGLVFLGAGAKVRGLSVDGFGGVCIALRGPGGVAGGNGDAGEGNRLGQCGVAIEAAGPDAVVTGNAVGQRPDGSAPGSGVAVRVTGTNAIVGGDGPFGNALANAVTGVEVGAGAGAPIANVRIRGNTFGVRRDNAIGPVATGVSIRQPSNGTTVQENRFANVLGSAIVLGADAGGLSTSRNRLTPNRYEKVGALAIDFNGDGARNPPGPGPNEGRAFPTITRAVTFRVTGSTNPPCPSCTVTVYAASHDPGGARDYGTAPLTGGGTTQADATGAFSLDGVSLPAATWVVALVTDANGNTSEFGTSARVGSGSLHCDPVTLGAAWNHAGFFGGASSELGDTFPGNLPGRSRVSTIAQLIDGTQDYRSWNAATTEDRTLSSLAVGDPYWFYADEAVTVEGGFTLSSALPVQLVAGWNDFVYLGAPAHGRDALASIAGKYKAVYRWASTADGARWLSFGDAATPSFAREFTDLTPCAVYQIFMTEDALLTPLQP